jgi:hypothetical protein
LDFLSDEGLEATAPALGESIAGSAAFISAEFPLGSVLLPRLGPRFEGDSARAFGSLSGFF